LRIDGHREHDRAITIIDDEGGCTRFAGGVIEVRETHATLLAELERDFFEELRSFCVGERRGLVALRPLEAREALQRRDAFAQREQIIAVRRDDARRVARIRRRERERDASRCNAAAAARGGVSWAT
jgi:hypothetical protein